MKVRKELLAFIYHVWDSICTELTRAKVMEGEIAEVII